MSPVQSPLCSRGKGWQATTCGAPRPPWCPNVLPSRRSPGRRCGHPPLPRHALRRMSGARQRDHRRERSPALDIRSPVQPATWMRRGSEMRTGPTRGTATWTSGPHSQHASMRTAAATPPALQPRHPPLRRVTGEPRRRTWRAAAQARQFTVPPAKRRTGRSLAG